MRRTTILRRGPWLPVLLIFLIGSPATLPAHEFWIEPEVRGKGLPATVRLFLRVGDGFPGELFPRRRSHVEEFRVDSPGSEAGRTPRGLEGRSPAGTFRIEKPGLHRVAYTSRPSRIHLAADSFEKYLREVGLESIIDARRERGESKQGATESYSRCARSLILAGEPASVEFRDRAQGLPLEIIAPGNPFSREGAVELEVRFEGKPLEGVLLVAHPRPEKGEKQPPTRRVRTDARGRVKVEGLGSGFHLFSVVHMVRAGSEEAGVDWRSYWASLTLTRAAGPPERVTRS